MTVTSISDATYGLSPSLVTKLEHFEAAIWDALEEATRAGVPMGLVVGVLEVAKIELVTVGICIEGPDDED